MQRQPTCNPPRCGLLGSLGHWLPVQQEPHPRHSRGKAGSTRRCSCAVPHHSTNRALGSLTSEVRRDLVHSTRSACWRPSPVAAASTWSHASCHRWPVAFSLGRGHDLFERPRRGPRSSSALPGERASTVSWLMSSGGVAPVASKRGTVMWCSRSAAARRLVPSKRRRDRLDGSMQDAAHVRACQKGCGHARLVQNINRVAHSRTVSCH